MASRVTHVISTEGRTLCGLLSTRSGLDLLPLADWLTFYRQSSGPTCPRCRHHLLQYSDTARSIRFSDLLNAPRCNAYLTNDNDPL